MSKYLGYLVIALVTLGVVILQFRQIKNLQNERDQHKRNSQALLKDVEHYKVQDSLNVAKVSVLELKVKDFEEYRAEDAQLIHDLNIKNQDLAAINKMQLQTISSFKTQVRDSIIYRDNNIIDTLRCVNVFEKWFDFNGCVDKSGLFVGTLVNRDSLVVVTTTSYKKFLGFLWRTNKIKFKHVDVLSKNPNTIIQDVELIELLR